MMDLGPFWLTVKLSFITSLILLIIGIPLAYYMAYSKSPLALIMEVITTLPLVLPPTVLGFYLLILFSKNGPLGALWERLLGYQLVFTFEGLVIASVIYSLPMMTHPLISGYRSVPKSLIEASWTLGKSKLETLFRVILPNMKASILVGLVLSFAHTLGEFGVVLMVGGNIEGKTRVASIVIYNAVESIDYATAHLYSLLLLSLSFLSLLTLYIINRRWVL
ncbi:MAG: molybdate ABC transporter permease subunit [Aquificota bacterium]|jgi:molybdate transport system permease protein